jgi:uncharacterized protein YoxC
MVDEQPLKKSKYNWIIIIGGIIVGLLIVCLFFWLYKKITMALQRTDNIIKNYENLEKQVFEINKSSTLLDNKLNKIENDFSKLELNMNNKLNNLETQFNKLETNITSKFEKLDQSLLRLGELFQQQKKNIIEEKE